MTAPDFGLPCATESRTNGYIAPLHWRHNHTQRFERRTLHVFDAELPVAMADGLAECIREEEARGLVASPSVHVRAMVMRGREPLFCLSGDMVFTSDNGFIVRAPFRSKNFETVEDALSSSAEFYPCRVEAVDRVETRRAAKTLASRICSLYPGAAAGLVVVRRILTPFTEEECSFDGESLAMTSADTRVASFALAG